MEIKKLSIKNFLGIDEADIKPGKINLIQGKNGKGKTSIIEAIQAAFRGADPKKVRLGKSKAEIYVETEEFQIRRRIPANGKGTVSVTSGEKESVVPKPQAFLDGIIGDFSFEPVKFFLMPEKTQTGYLLEAIKCSATAAQLKKWTHGLIENVQEYVGMHGLKAVALLRDTLFQERTSVNRRVKSLQGAVDEARDRLPSNVEKFDGEKWRVLNDRLSGIKAAEERMDSLRRQSDDRVRDLQDLALSIEQTKKQLAELQGRVTVKTEEKNRIDRDMLKVEIGDAVEIEKSLEAMNAAQAHQRQLIELENLKKEYSAEKSTSEILDQAVKALQNDAPAELIKSVDMPITGLEYDSELKAFTLKGVPISNLSTSEKARFAVAVTKKINAGYKLKLICLDGFEALDKEVQKAFLSLAEKDGFQYFVTEVSEDEEVKVAVTV